jgi:predicted nucleic acid-binding protein
MSVQSIYLDSSVIVKRYVVEEGTEKVDKVYDGAHAGRLKIGFSLWNIGEVAVVLDKYHRRQILGDAREVFTRFIGETKFLSKLGQLKLVLLDLRILPEATNHVFKYGIYFADAIQLASAREFDGFLTYDTKLAQIAKLEGLKLVSDPS